MNLGVCSQVVDVPVGSEGQLMMVGDPGTQTTWTQRAPQVNVIPTLKLHRSQVPDLNTGIALTGKNQRICSGLRLNDHFSQSLFGLP
jgi:hypothetical protein